MARHGHDDVSQTQAEQRRSAPCNGSSVDCDRPYHRVAATFLYDALELDKFSCLPNFELRISIRFEDSRAVQKVLAKIPDQGSR